MSGVFFTIRAATLQLRDAVGDLNKFFGQFLESLVVGHFHLGLLGLIGRDALGTLAALQRALQNKIGALTNLLSLNLSGEKLFTQRTAPEPVYGLDLLEDLLSFATEFRDGEFHVLHIVSVTIQYQAETSPVIGSI